MNVLIPMAGAGLRFLTKGYNEHKPVLPLTSRRSCDPVPMVVEAVNDLPVDMCNTTTNLVFIVRKFHIIDGVDQILLKHFPAAVFIEIDELTEGQASTCLLAREYFDNDQPLLIASCDNGMDLPEDSFELQTQSADALIFTFQGNDAILQNPKAYGWVSTSGDIVTGVSIKQPISNTPLRDHAITGTFWFKRGCDFFNAADKMISANDRINGEFYVDQVFKYIISAGYSVWALPVSRYLCWGTPEDYEIYEATMAYWTKFSESEDWVL